MFLRPDLGFSMGQKRLAHCAISHFRTNAYPKSIYFEPPTSLASPEKLVLPPGVPAPKWLNCAPKSTAKDYGLPRDELTL